MSTPRTSSASPTTTPTPAQCSPRPEATERAARRPGPPVDRRWIQATERAIGAPAAARRRDALATATHPQRCGASSITRVTPHRRYPWRRTAERGGPPRSTCPRTRPRDTVAEWHVEARPDDGRRFVERSLKDFHLAAPEKVSEVIAWVASDAARGCQLRTWCNCVLPIDVVDGSAGLGASARRCDCRAHTDRREAPVAVYRRLPGSRCTARRVLVERMLRRLVSE